MSYTREKKVDSMETSEYLKKVLARIDKASKDADTLALKIQGLREEIHDDIAKLKQTKKKVVQEYLVINDYPITSHTLEYAKIIGKGIFTNIVRAFSPKLCAFDNTAWRDIFNYDDTFDYIFCTDDFTTEKGEILFKFSSLSDLLLLLLDPTKLVTQGLYYNLADYLFDISTGSNIQLRVLKLDGNICTDYKSNWYEHIENVKTGEYTVYSVNWAEKRGGVVVQNFDKRQCVRVSGVSSQLPHKTMPVYFPMGLDNLGKNLIIDE